MMTVAVVVVASLVVAAVVALLAVYRYTRGVAHRVGRRASNHADALYDEANARIDAVHRESRAKTSELQHALEMIRRGRD